MSASAFEIAAAIDSCSYRYAHEVELQDGIAARLSMSGIRFEREVLVGPGDRIDFLARRMGIEVKVAGSARDLERQLERYAASSLIDSLLVVTGRQQVGYLPTEVGGKPVFVIALRRALR